MWPGGEELNEDDGKPVRIYQPILYAGSRKPSLDDVTCTCIGGAPSMELRCPQCNDPLYPLAQLHTAAPLKRTLQVWACNRLSCLRSLFSDDSNNGASDGEGNALCHGGGQGVVVCRRIPPPNVAAANSSSDTPIPVSHPPTIQTVVVNEWTMQDEQGGDGNDKMADDLDMADLESKLAAMESKKEATSTKPSSQGRVGPSAKATASSGETSASSGFPMFELHSLPEPRAMQPSYDDDDVGMSSGGRGGADDKKIQQMLSQYMAMEDDEEILSVLRGTMSGGGGVGATGKGNAERDERLSASDRALWAFTDRMKLAPRQVLRYAFGGVPLWSM
jgi:pre-rRNA-processing protein TSR4